MNRLSLKQKPALWRVISVILALMIVIAMAGLAGCKKETPSSAEPKPVASETNFEYSPVMEIYMGHIKDPETGKMKATDVLYRPRVDENNQVVEYVPVGATAHSDDRTAWTIKPNNLVLLPVGLAITSEMLETATAEKVSTKPGVIQAERQVFVKDRTQEKFTYGLTEHGGQTEFYQTSIDRSAEVRSFAEEVFRLTNLEREKAGLQPVVWDDLLYDVASNRVNESTQVWAHTRPTGERWNTILAEYSVDLSMGCGENLAFGFVTAESVVAAWMSSPGHRAAILGKYRYMAPAVTFDSNGIMYWTQTFYGMDFLDDVQPSKVGTIPDRPIEQPPATVPSNNDPDATIEPIEDEQTVDDESPTKDDTANEEPIVEQDPASEDSTTEQPTGEDQTDTEDETSEGDQTNTGEQTNDPTDQTDESADQTDTPANETDGWEDPSDVEGADDAVEEPAIGAPVDDPDDGFDYDPVTDTDDGLLDNTGGEPPTEMLIVSMYNGGVTYDFVDSDGDGVKDGYQITSVIPIQNPDRPYSIDNPTERPMFTDIGGRPVVSLSDAALQEILDEIQSLVDAGDNTAAAARAGEYLTWIGANESMAAADAVTAVEEAKAKVEAAIPAAPTKPAKPVEPTTPAEPTPTQPTEPSNGRTWVPEKYETISHPAEYQTIEHPAVPGGYSHLECKTCGFLCGAGPWYPEAQADPISHMVDVHGVLFNPDKSQFIEHTTPAQPAWTEQKLVREAWTEQRLVYAGHWHEKGQTVCDICR